MKSKLALILGAALLAGSAFAQTNQVLSKNAVGYVKVDLVASNKLHIIRNDFEPLGAPMAISNALNGLPIGSQVLLWDPGAQAYKAAITKGLFGWPPQASNVLDRGAAFFIRTAATATNVATYPLYLMGEVPDATTAPNSSLNAAAGLTLVGHPYPVAEFWTNTVLAQSLPLGSQVLLWNPSSQSYSAAITKGLFGWPPAGNSLVLQPGQGFFVRATNSVPYVEVKPYTWP